MEELFGLSVLFAAVVRQICVTWNSEQMCKFYAHYTDGRRALVIEKI